MASKWTPTKLNKLMAWYRARQLQKFNGVINRYQSLIAPSERQAREDGAGTTPMDGVSEPARRTIESFRAKLDAILLDTEAAFTRTREEFDPLFGPNGEHTRMFQNALSVCALRADHDIGPLLEEMDAALCRVCFGDSPQEITRELAEPVEAGDPPMYCVGGRARFFIPRHEVVSFWHNHFLEEAHATEGGTIKVSPPQRHMWRHMRRSAQLELQRCIDALPVNNPLRRLDGIVRMLGALDNYENPIKLDDESSAFQREVSLLSL